MEKIATINSKELITTINRETHLKIKLPDNKVGKSLMYYSDNGIGFDTVKNYRQMYGKYKIMSEEQFIKEIKKSHGKGC